jgi:hypothetical protein
MGLVSYLTKIRVDQNRQKSQFFQNLAIQVLQHHILAFGPCIMSEPSRGASRGIPTSLDSLLSVVATPLGFRF